MIDIYENKSEFGVYIWYETKMHYNLDLKKVEVNGLKDPRHLVKTNLNDPSDNSKSILQYAIKVMPNRLTYKWVTMIYMSLLDMIVGI